MSIAKIYPAAETIKIKKEIMPPTKDLIGKKITIKILSEKQFEQYHEMLSPTVRKILNLPLTATLKDTKVFLSERLNKMKNLSLLFFGTIFDNVDQKLIGAIEIREPEENPGQIGAWLNENYWGGGRYQEALALAIEEYFEWAQINYVNVHVETTNTRSIKAHQKFGFKIVDQLEKDGKKLYNMVFKERTD